MLSRLGVALAAALALWGSVANAHPSLISSSPKAGEVLNAAPREMRLEFNEAVEASFTSIKIVDSSGNELSVAAVQVDPGDPKGVVAPLTALPAGNYRVLWSAPGRDGHRVKGEFTFSVR